MAGLFKCPDFFYNSIPNEKICKDCEQSKMHIPEEDLEKNKRTNRAARYKKTCPLYKT